MDKEKQAKWILDQIFLISKKSNNKIGVFISDKKRKNENDNNSNKDIKNMLYLNQLPDELVLKILEVLPIQNSKNSLTIVDLLKMRGSGFNFNTYKQFKLNDTMYNKLLNSLTFDFDDILKYVEYKTKNMLRTMEIKDEKKEIINLINVLAEEYDDITINTMSFIIEKEDLEYINLEFINTITLDLSRIKDVSDSLLKTLKFISFINLYYKTYNKGIKSFNFIFNDILVSKINIENKYLYSSEELNESDMITNIFVPIYKKLFEIIDENIETLSISNISTYLKIDYFKTLPNIKYLTLNNVIIRNIEIKLKHLEYLNLQECNNNIINAYMSIESLTKLKKLILSLKY